MASMRDNLATRILPVEIQRMRDSIPMPEGVEPELVAKVLCAMFEEQVQFEAGNGCIYIAGDYNHLTTMNIKFAISFVQTANQVLTPAK